MPSYVPPGPAGSASTVKSVPTYSVPVVLSWAIAVTGRSPSGPVPLSMSVHVAVPVPGWNMTSNTWPGVAGVAAL